MKKRGVGSLSWKTLALRACGLLVFFSCARVGAAAVPTPESHFGHKIGADRELLDWDKVVNYFYALAKASDRIHVVEYGRSAENRPMIMATIADPATLRNLA